MGKVIIAEDRRSSISAKHSLDFSDERFLEVLGRFRYKPVMAGEVNVDISDCGNVAISEEGYIVSGDYVLCVKEPELYLDWIVPCITGDTGSIGHAVEGQNSVTDERKEVIIKVRTVIGYSSAEVFDNGSLGTVNGQQPGYWLD